MLYQVHLAMSVIRMHNFMSDLYQVHLAMSVIQMHNFMSDLLFSQVLQIPF
jgi:hypothetical protein